MEKIIRKYPSDITKNVFRGLDAMEIYFNWNSLNDVFKYSNSGIRILNEVNKSEMIIDLDYISFSVSNATIPRNYAFWTEFIFSENWLAFKWFTLLFGKNMADVKVKNKLVIHWKMFSVYDYDFIYNLVEKIFNTWTFTNIKRFDITLDIPKSKNDILTKKQFKIYNKEELEKLNDSEKNKVCWAMFWKWETMYFGNKFSRTSYLRIYDKIAEVKSWWLQKFYPWITNYSNLNRFEIQFWDEFCKYYLWSDILSNREKIVEKIYYNEIIKFIPQIDYWNYIFPEKIQLLQNQKNTWYDEYFSLWDFSDKYKKTFSWWIKNLYNKTGSKWLNKLLLNDLNDYEKYDFIKWLIEENFIWDEQKRFNKSFKDTFKIYEKRKIKNLSKLNALIIDVWLFAKLEYYYSESETFHYVSKSLNDVLYRINKKFPNI